MSVRLAPHELAAIRTALDRIAYELAARERLPGGDEYAGRIRESAASLRYLVDRADARQTVH
jgi:hypothetical protein